MIQKNIVSHTRWQVAKYWSALRTQLINNLAYPADAFARSIMMVMFMWIFAQLWRTVYGAEGASSIAGMTLADTMWYLMFAETIMIGQPIISTPISEQVKDGSIAYLLAKPFNFLLYQFSVGLGDSLLQIFANLVAGSAIVWYLVGPPPELFNWGIGLVSMVLAILINFCIHAMIGLLAFVTEEISAFQWIYSKFILIMGGVLIPLDFFPVWLQKISFAFPFAYTTYGPARLFVDPTPERMQLIFTGQIIWVVVLGLLLSWFYKRSQRHLAINGG